MRFLDWASSVGINSRDADVSKFCLVIQVDPDFPDLTGAEQGVDYVRTFMRDVDTLSVIEGAVRKAWNEYAEYSSYGYAA